MRWQLTSCRTASFLLISCFGCFWKEKTKPAIFRLPRLKGTPTEPPHDFLLKRMYTNRHSRLVARELLPNMSPNVALREKHVVRHSPLNQGTPIESWNTQPPFRETKVGSFQGSERWRSRARLIPGYTFSVVGQIFSPTPQPPAQHFGPRYLLSIRFDWGFPKVFPRKLRCWGV